MLTNYYSAATTDFQFYRRKKECLQSSWIFESRIGYDEKYKLMAVIDNYVVYFGEGNGLTANDYQFLQN